MSTTHNDYFDDSNTILISELIQGINYILDKLHFADYELNFYNKWHARDAYNSLW